ncbi:MAG: Dabb family protein [Clostridia bacterium]|nr:Dabb family protein [Clostridia bacterium]
MVKHIILWNLKDEYQTSEIKSGIKENLESLIGVIPGLIDIKVFVNPLETSNADIMLYSVFEDYDSLKGYAVHPKHIYVADTFVRPYTKSRCCMDFED